MLRTIYYENGTVYILDQNQLPGRVEYVPCQKYEDIAQAIVELKLRGAPLIGVAAAYALALAVLKYDGAPDRLKAYYRRAEEVLSATRPTAVNLFWAIRRMARVFAQNEERSAEYLAKALLQEAESLRREDIRINQSLGDEGQVLLPPGARVLTICNAGALATCGYGTALGVIRSAHKLGKIEMVWVCETRPVLQGARLTVWELAQDGIPHTLITDNMAAAVIKLKSIDAVITGADRIAANGDTANKIGTYSLAVLANYHSVPFYVAAPLSTVDLDTPEGRDIPIEERNPEEVRRIGERYITRPEVNVYNPAFDVTPASLIDGIITEKGVVKPPYGEGLKRMIEGEKKP